MKHLWKTLAIATPLVGLLAGCGGGGGGSSTGGGGVDTTSAISVTPVSCRIAPLAAKTFSANVNTTGDKSVSWMIQEMGGGSVSQSGVYTAPPMTGVYHLWATSVADPTKVASATIFVENGALSSVRLDPHTVSIERQDRVRFAANSDVRWTVKESNGGSITSDGLYTAPNIEGTFHVVATSKTDSTKLDTAAITVEDIVVPTNPF